MTTLASIKFEDTESLRHLKKIAWKCFCLQFFAAVFYLFAGIAFPDSNTIAVGCGISSILISLYPVFYALDKKCFSLVFSCIIFFNLAPIWFLYLEAVLPGYDAYTHNAPVERMNALFWVSIFQMFSNLFYVSFWKYISNFSIKTFSFLNTMKLGEKFYSRLAIIAFLVPLIAFYYYYGSAQILWTAITAGRSGGGSAGGLLIRDSIGGSSSFLLPFDWLWQLTPLLGCIAFILSEKKYHFKSFLPLLLGLFVIFSFFLSGTRSATIAVAGPVLFFIFYYNWDRGIRFWIVAVSIFFLLIAAMELQVRFRGNLLDVLSNPSQTAKANNLKSITTFNPTASHRDNNMYFLCLIVKGYPQKYPFEGFNEFVTTLVNPIPRALWQGKPITSGAKDLINQQDFILDGPIFSGTTSLSFSVVGEAYKANGLIGILLYTLVYAFFLLYFDGIIYYTKDKQALAVGLSGISIFLSFWGFRSFLALVTFLYPLLLLLFLLGLIRIVKRL